MVYEDAFDHAKESRKALRDLKVNFAETFTVVLIFMSIVVKHTHKHSH